MEFFTHKIGEIWGTPWDVRTNMKCLKRRLKELNTLQKGMRSRRTVLHPRKTRCKEVNLWFKSVKRIKRKTRHLDQKIQERNFFFGGFLKGNVFRIMQEVQELFQQGKSHDSLLPDNHGKMIGQTLRTETLIGADAMREEIWSYLMCAGVHRIAVFGTEGMGKTAIMKHINNQLLKEIGKFNMVIWITVSEGMSITQMQDRIARAMKVTLDEAEDEIVRAGMIEGLLTQGKYVIILDGLNHNFSLEDVGIPDPDNGSKLMITTREINVCYDMDFQEIIPLQILSESYALELFLKKLCQDVSNNPDLLAKVELACKNCAGLPSKIISSATKMKVGIKMSTQ